MSFRNSQARPHMYRNCWIMQVLALDRIAFNALLGSLEDIIRAQEDGKSRCLGPWFLGKGIRAWEILGPILGCCPNGKEWDTVCEICGFCWLKLSKIPLWGISDSEPILKIKLPLASSCTYQHTCRDVEENIVVSNQSLVHIYEHSNMQTNIAGNLPPRWYSANQWYDPSCRAQDY